MMKILGVLGQLVLHILKKSFISIYEKQYKKYIERVSFLSEKKYYFLNNDYIIFLQLNTLLLLMSNFSKVTLYK